MRWRRKAPQRTPSIGVKNGIPPTFKRSLAIRLGDNDMTTDDEAGYVNSTTKKYATIASLVGAASSLAQPLRMNEILEIAGEDALAGEFRDGRGVDQRVQRSTIHQSGSKVMHDIIDSIEQQSNEPEVWKPPVAAVGTLAGLFGIALAVRHSPVADAGRTVMTVVSSIASVAIAAYGIKMILAARARGIASAIAGIVMVILGVMTTLHVLK